MTRGVVVAGGIACIALLLAACGSQSDSGAARAVRGHYNPPVDASSADVDGPDGSADTPPATTVPFPTDPPVSNEKCGDGVRESEEACDDGNTSGGDGCSATCTVEPPFSCPIAGEPCQQCGDGVFQGNEDCDDGNTEDGDGCNSNCFIENSGPCLVGCGACGDAVIEAAEDCDDGNTDDGDGCSALCTLEPRFLCLVPGEACVQCGSVSTDAGETACSLGDAGLFDAAAPVDTDL